MTEHETRIDYVLYILGAAIEQIERLPADVRLTDAVVLAGEARDAVKDYATGVVRRRFVRHAYDLNATGPDA